MWGPNNRALVPALVENPEVAAAITKVQDEGKELVKRSREKKSTELDSKLSSERFLGAEKCSRCHEQESEQWKATPHARAWASLVSEDKQTDSACVGCHVTGWKEPSGFASLAGNSNLGNVQCESCHGIGTEHARGEKAAKVTEEAFKDCPTGGGGKEFKFAASI